MEQPDEIYEMYEFPTIVEWRYATNKQETSVPTVTALQNRIEALQAEIIRLEALPPEPTARNATITFQIQFNEGGVVYSYAARKSGRNWFTTGPKGGGMQRTWEELIGWIDSMPGGLAASHLGVVSKVKPLT